MGPFGFSKKRNDEMDYATYLGVAFNHIIAFQKKPELNPWGFLFPYSLWLWIGILGSLLTMVLLFRLFTSNSLPKAFHQAYGVIVEQGKECIKIWTIIN